MSDIACQFVNIDVPSDLLTTSGQTIEFSLNNSSCGGTQDSKNQTYEFALVRASQCNGNIQTILPLVRFEQSNTGSVASVRMTMVEPIPTWQPSLVPCARVSIRIEYWPQAKERRFCLQQK